MKQKLEPVITETSLKNTKSGGYTFRAPIGENKNSLKEFAKKVFKVDILAVKTLTVKGKRKRSMKTRKESFGSDWKKVIFKLKEGQKIDLFDQI